MSFGALVGGFVLCVLVILFRRAAALLQLRKDSWLLPVDESNSRDRTDYATMIAFFGAIGAFVFLALILAKIILR